MFIVGVCSFESQWVITLFGLVLSVSKIATLLTDLKE